MKAAVLREFKRPLTIEEIDPPRPEAQEVLIEVEACGVCHSDLHVADGDWPQLARIVKKPLILGHEIVGRVVEKGAAVRSLKVGDRVGVPWLHWSCGECEFCREGNENLCARQRITGVTIDGGYAEFAKAPASHAIAIPEKLSASEAAPIFCAGVTVYRALKHSGISRGQRLAVFGIGGLGHIGIQIGTAFGAEVAAIDVSEEKLALAKSLGAVQTFNASSTDVAKRFREIGGAHVALVTSAAKAAYQSAFYCVRPSGVLLVVGLPSEDICFPPILMAAREIRMHSSAVGTRQDLLETLKLAAEGKVRCQVSTRPLAEANESLGTTASRESLRPNRPDSPLISHKIRQDGCKVSAGERSLPKRVCFRLDVSLSNVICAITISQVTRDPWGAGWGQRKPLNRSSSEREFEDSLSLLSDCLTA